MIFFYTLEKFVKLITKQGRKHPLDTPKKMIERTEKRERRRERERKVQGEI